MRRMKTKQIESTVTNSGNSGHIIVPKDWIGRDVIVKIKEDRK
jgi:putative transposon-encoded protein